MLGTFEKLRKKKTPEERAEITRKAKETRQQREQELEMEQRRLGLEAEYPSMEGLDRVDDDLDEILRNMASDIGNPTVERSFQAFPPFEGLN